ncbi:MAG TPA: biotin carboxylase N-terminal domain-containing protein [Actinophytocola sp.]|uniref:acetyl/propionyl/methylcrotonyl-CoA carboxylase subunit alpha n=1 Tax=Actinophytocola sp. TaxID=1872138 RepID=UPI002DB5902A|nr:biotin carboxylase N-terminal domain-containing protein [Actinophytocola sp.]HEU5472208.1 biotin carboxylase N-terminal domain-containing protein [Actinophytocola sp.]
MITNVLVANRGEIARRVFRTCADAGIGTVAVYSDADAGAPHVAEADAAVRLPGNAPAETYLRADALIGAAKRAGADAVHPGYGFLSENAAFARAVTEAGLTWIGPPAEAIAAMGSKIESKRLMADAGVPVLSELDPDAVTEADLPLLVKASAGGGGRGMRVVRALAELAGALEAARSEAGSAFGDPTVFCEPYLATGRHIEVQILADAHGTVWAVGERECSIQRRHQKVVEETPSPLVQRVSGMRERLFDAARAAARAIGYVGAGTVEFLADESGRFFFLEMNTRLQVEHPVTECVTGLDLVALQLAVAGGAALPAEPPAPSGHAIEVRLYAEDPAADWRPQSGPLHRFEVPGVTAELRNPAGPGIRLDSGVRTGSVVSVHYDPMLAKVIAWAPSRDAAARALAGALTRSRIHGLATNRDLLVRVLRHPAFLAGDTDTAFFDRHGLAGLAEPLADKESTAVSVVAAALADAAANRAAATVLGRIPSGWRNVGAAPQVKRYRCGPDEVEVRYRHTRSGVTVAGHEGLRVLEATPERVVLLLGGVRRTFDVARYPGQVWVDSPLGSVPLSPVDRFPDPASQVAAGSLLAPMPGTVVRVAVSLGDKVTEGQPLLWLEAMKMEHRIAAPSDGVVAELAVAAGDQVEVGRVLAVVEELS